MQVPGGDISGIVEEVGSGSKVCDLLASLTIPLTVKHRLQLSPFCYSSRKATEFLDWLPGFGCLSMKAHMQSMSVLRKSGLHTAQNCYHCMRPVKSRLYL